MFPYHDASKDAIEEDSPHHRFRKYYGGIFQLLRHMGTRIWTNEAPQWG
jgi:hypothetical protein